MKITFGFILLIVFLSSCSEQIYVTSDYDRTVDLNQYKTFKWAKNQEQPSKGNPMIDNELNRKRISDAVEKELINLGLTPSLSDPDLLIDFHIVIDENTHYVAHDYYPFPFRYWPEYSISSYTVKTSTIIIHFVDFKKEQLVWQGTGNSRLTDPPTPYTEDRIKQTIKEILKQFPKNK
ncbi:MAG: DUF4136 domain-containing protein [Algoriphagus sp.]|uniref:DUF4136 domain-containing protein n=1 Tax=Algoriphagus sp. TaxID=1872435 RepID=UPI002636BBD1|nr:DUF4136 domain-containing protein [Algoriphagus sp.]MDG1276513.1 DUF4136 domain-containing protein [Algoriphagus sp.]